MVKKTICRNVILVTLNVCWLVEVFWKMLIYWDFQAQLQYRVYRV